MSAFFQLFIFMIAVLIIANFFFIPVMSIWLGAISGIADERSLAYNQNAFRTGIFVLIILVVGGFIWLVAKMLRREEFEYLR